MNRYSKIQLSIILPKADRQESSIFMPKLSLNRKLNIVKGQIDGIIDMIEKDRPDSSILTQIKAAKSGLNSVSLDIIKTYLKDLSRNKRKREELERIVKRFIS